MPTRPPTTPAPSADVIGTSDRRRRRGRGTHEPGRLDRRASPAIAAARGDRLPRVPAAVGTLDTADPAGRRPQLRRQAPRRRDAGGGGRRSRSSRSPSARPTSRSGRSPTRTRPRRRSSTPGSVRVTVASGLEQVPMPDLRNKTEAQAVQEIVTAGLRPGLKTEAFDPTVPVGLVVSQIPGTGCRRGQGHGRRLRHLEGPRSRPHRRRRRRPRRRPRP